MKTIGLIGGISWHSTAVYYKLINQLISERFGGNHSAKLILYSVNYDDFKQHQTKNDWKQIGFMLSEVALKLEGAGADCIVICSNTPHMIAEEIEERINIPLLHIAEAMAKEIVKQKIGKVGLLGTKFTMETHFFIDKLEIEGIEVIIPDQEDRTLIHSSIITELAKGEFNQATKMQYLSIINDLKHKGAQAIILGCTEIGLLLSQVDCEIKLLDTTIIHAATAVEYALNIKSKIEYRK